MVTKAAPSRFARTRGVALSTVATLATLLACGHPASGEQVRHGEVSVTDTSLNTLSREDAALRYPFVPDPAKTPGATLDVTAADICTPGYAKRVRNVPIEVKRQVYASYGVRERRPGEYEIDHLINLSLGGSNSIRNLWPESFRITPWNAYVKDSLEVELHRRVCAGTIDLRKAQQVIARNWVQGYRIYVHPNAPQTPPSSASRVP
jgi:hypothetical protein